MIKLLIFLAIGYFALKALRGISGQGTQSCRGSDCSRRDEIDDLMVQDPNCRAYIPKREAVLVQKNGKKLYFCSEKCRDNYLANIYN